MDRLARIVHEDGPSSYVDALVDAAREHLGLEIAYVSEFTDGHQVFDVVSGDGASFGIQEGGAVPLPETYCQRMLSDEIPNLITDAVNDDRVNCLVATTNSSIGAYVGIPIRFSDGTLFGTFCSLSHEAAPQLTDRDLNFVRVLARLVANFLEQEKVSREKNKLEVEAAGMQALIAALEARDGYTGEHSGVVRDLCVNVAEILGVTGADLGVVRQVALLHDIGKVGIPDHILRKNGPLASDEWAIMKTHPDVGRTIVEATASLAHLGPAIAAEHERWDGTGYPVGLKGGQIPLESRIVLACDAWHAMTSDRPYRKALPVESAVQQLIDGKGSQFDPRVVDALLFLLGDGPQAVTRFRRSGN